MIYRKDLCTRAEFENMAISGREKYLNKIYGGSSVHRVLVEVEKISDSEVVVDRTHFIFDDGTIQEFCLFKDDPYSRNVAYDAPNIVLDFCLKNKLFNGDKFIYEIYANSKSLLAIRGGTLEKVNVQHILETYKKIGVPYEPDTLYELRQEDNEKSLEILVFGDINKKIENLINEKKLQIEQLQKEIDAKRAELKFLELFGVSQKLPTESKNYYDEDLTEFDDIFDVFFQWQAFLYNSGEKLFYDIDILQHLYLALHTNQLILLTGSPGTGKTSLVRNLTKSFKFEDAAIIPVQSSWTDKSDLLGYYNSLEKTYVSTPFLDALIDFCEKAKLQPPEKLFIICLDEMNLAHIEYYFAEFLSKLQDDRKIRLYSDSLKENILRELKYSGFENFEGKPKQDLSISERKYYFELCRLAQMISRYSAVFEIPENVKFIGTLNQDETTLDISPKVLDRSYVIRVEKLNEEKENFQINSMLKYTGDYSKPMRFMLFSGYENEETKNLFKEMCCFANISKRVENAIMNLPFQYDDFIVEAFLLPRIRWEGEEYKSKIEDLKKFCEDKPFSKVILAQIDSGEDIDFWRR